MALKSLGGAFEACAKELLKAAVGQDPPADFPSAMVENMVKSVVEPIPGMPEDLAYQALGAALSMAHGSARELSKNEIQGVIKRHFKLG